ncbi:hypothetical protein [Accumulibacter sp.]|uniref:hypothetical protein n=1 Tax=Accumulibacter sp. TaxID=2053492 RepID=UPI0025D7072D|nr:hypothetical protein [Accumulibacter sp.]MCP5228347.1 hypothetical protein [Accumulibacter sp.]
MKTSTMKNVIMGSVLAVAAVTSLSANGATQSICTGGAAGDGQQVAAGTDFVKVAFTPKCSANVILTGEDVSATVYKVGSASLKGKTIFAGSSLGGSVGNVGTCAASPCTSSEVSTKIAALPSS